MKLVRSSFARPVSFPSFWNEFFADDFLTKNMRGRKSCSTSSLSRRPAVNVKENAESYVIELAAPGFDKSDFSLELDKELLTISVEKEVEKEEEGLAYISKEFVSDNFKRTFTISESSIDAGGIKATYSAGILEVFLPKKEVEETKLNIDVL